MILPKMDDLLKKKAEKSYVIYEEILSDFHTPISILNKLNNNSNKCFLLESVLDNESWGRYSFLGYNPISNLVVKDNKVYLDDNLVNESITDVIFSLLNLYSEKKDKSLPPFTGGLLGYFSYDSIKYFESAINIKSKKDYDFNDIQLMLFDKIIAFDNLKKKVFIIKNILSNNLKQNYNNAIEEINDIKNLINKEINYKFKPTIIGEFQSNMTKEKFCENIDVAKKHIRDGDIFQVVLSQRFSADIEGDLFNTYRVLRTSNPSPYLYYFRSNDLEIAGASPETLVKVVDGVVSTFPIAGTRKRGKSIEEDLELENELLKDEKELAEHNMLVDLGRNDCGKISEFGSVKVKDYMKINRFSKVMHITSLVEGKLRDSKNSLDALKAILPAGTLSGAPKIMACNIIDKLEPSARGQYGGAIGYIDFSKNMDMCITIRTAIKKDDKVHVQAGGGIVVDSIPINEYEESCMKASAMIQAIKEANKVL